MDNSSLSHTKWDCTYHVVFIPKYRRKVMYGELRSDIREIIKKLRPVRLVNPYTTTVTRPSWRRA